MLIHMYTQKYIYMEHKQAHIHSHTYRCTYIHIITTMCIHMHRYSHTHIYADTLTHTQLIAFHKVLAEVHP